VGIIFLDWSAGRMLAFYYLDLCSVIIAYIAYNFIIEDIQENIGPVIMATAMIFLIYGLIFSAIISLTGEFGEEWKSPLDLYAPYFDVPLYLIGLLGVQVSTVKQYLKMPKDLGKSNFSFFLITYFFLIPSLILSSLLFLFINSNMKINMVISLLILRHFLEYKRNKSFEVDS
jgi:hypothetical protein